MRFRDQVKALLGAAGIVAASLAVTTASADPMVTPEFHSDVLNSLSITDGELTSIDLSRMNNGNFSFTIPLEGDQVGIEIWSHDIRSAGYRLIEQIEDGSYVDVEPGPVSTFRGIVSEIPDAVVAASVMDGQIYALILMPDGTRHWVEPLSSRFPEVDRNLHAVYAQEDVIPSLGMCAVVDSFIEKTQAMQEPEVSLDRGGGDCGGMCVAELGADADFEFYQAFGSSTFAVENAINSIINSVNVLYENQVGITHEITGIIVRTSEPDPYSTTNAGSLLDQFRQHWLVNVGNSIPHDTAQLFTGKNLNGSTIGIAFLGGVCNSLRYSLVETTCCGSFACRTDLSAHELGHNWDSEHHNGSNSTMNPGLVCANNFITPSRDAIIAFRNSRNCLSPLPQLDPPGSFNLVSPANGAVEVPRNPTIQWSGAADANFYRVTLADNPEFVSPKISNFNTTSTQISTLPPNFLDEGVTYYWKVVAFNDAGTTDSTPQIATFTVEGSLPEPCPGDADGNQIVNLDDLNIVLSNFGQSTDDGDVDGNGSVDLNDLNLVLSNFGNSCE